MDFCYKSARIWQIVGYIMAIVKIIIPLVIIVLGVIDLGRAVVSSDQKIIKDAGGNLVKRVILGICIFFIPTIIDFIFDVVGGLSEEMHEDYENCFNCLTHPDSCDTSYDPNDLNNDAIYPVG